LGELQAGTGARDQTRQEHEIAIGAERDRGPQLLAAVFTNVILARNYFRKGMYEEGLATCRKVSLCESSPLSRALSSLILAMAGKTDEAQKILNELKGYRKLDSWSLL